MKRLLFVLIIFFTGCTVTTETSIQPLTTGNFQFVAACPTDRFLTADPILFPGQANAGHHHLFFGAKNVDHNSTILSMQKSATTCVDRPGDTAGYWVPALYADGKLARPREIRAYYRSEGANGEAVVPFPEGLKIIAGDAHAMSPQPITIFNWACTIQGTGDEIEVNSPPVCDSTSPSLRYEVKFPRCGAVDANGLPVLDSADHKSHMAYGVGTGCPASHPLIYPKLTIGIRYWYGDPTYSDAAGTVESGTFDRDDTFTLSSGPHYTGHADFMMAWHNRNFKDLVAYCINQLRNCGDFDPPHLVQPTHDKIVISQSATRSPFVDLLTSPLRTVSGSSNRVFADIHDSMQIASVKFFEKATANPTTWTLKNTDTSAPYDFVASPNNSANPYTFNVYPFTEAVRMRVGYTDGSYKFIAAQFNAQ